MNWNEATSEYVKFPTNLRWHVVLTLADAEWQAYNGLLRRGVETLHPYVLKEVRRGKYTQGIIRPWFPGYLFAGIVPNEQTIEDIRAVTGVRNVLREGGFSAGDCIVMAQSQIEALRLSWARALKDCLPVANIPQRWRPGDWVTVPEGRLQGIPMQVEHVVKDVATLKLGNLTVTVKIGTGKTALREAAPPAELEIAT